MNLKKMPHRVAILSAPETFELHEVNLGNPGDGEVLGCALNIFERSGIQPGQSVAIVGVGAGGPHRSAPAVHPPRFAR